MAKEKAAPSSMMTVLANLRKSFGNDAVFSGDDEVLETPEAISTGSYALDSTIGLLGVPRGRVTQFAGAEASGKTFMALQIVKNWQAQHPENYALWIDAEFSFDMDWAVKLGVDKTRLHVKSENLGSEIFNFLCGIPNPKNTDKKDKLGALDELILAGDQHCGLIVIDSIAAILPPVEAAYEVGKQNMAAMARFMPQALRRLVPLVHKANVALVAINQLRVDPGVQYGNPETSPGGRAWKHFCRLMINFAKVNAKEELILNADDEPIGHTVRAKIQKNSFAMCRDTKFVIKYVQGVANHNVEMVELGIKYAIIQRPNNVMYIYGDQKWKGREAVEEAFLDKALFGEVWEKVKIARVQLEGQTAPVETPSAEEEFVEGE
jgi:recombination protein RecA